MTERRLGAAGGLLFVVLSVIAGVVLPKPPDPDASAASIGRYLAEHQHRIEIASAGAAIAAIALLLLVVHLHERLAADPFAARLVLAGGSSLVAVAVLGAMVQAMVAQVGDRLHGDSLVLAFALDEAIFYAAPGFAVVALLAGFARGAVAARLPSWLAALGILVAALGLVGGVGQLTTTSTAVGAIGFAGFILTVVWVAATSVVLLRDRTPSVATATA